MRCPYESRHLLTQYFFLGILKPIRAYHIPTLLITAIILKHKTKYFL